MRAAAFLVLLCACDQLFGLQTTIQIDAQFFDAPADAPFACPPIGTTPQYNPYVTLIAANGCVMYSPSFGTGHGVGLCDGDIYEGPFEGPMKLVVANSDPNSFLDLPRLSLDGKHLYVRKTSFSTGVTSILAYASDSNGNWTPAPSPGLPAQPNLWFSTFVRAVDGDRVMLSTPGGGTLDEWTNAGGAWHQLATHPATELGVQSVDVTTITSDGLRLLFRDASVLDEDPQLYSDRPDQSSPFRPGQPLAGVPPRLGDATMADDCSHVFFTGLSALFSVHE
jgi:hypothetical protein